MPVQLGLSDAQTALDIRRGGDRRSGDRRAQRRETPDRRRGDRRRGALRGLFFSSLLLVPQPTQLAVALPPNPLREPLAASPIPTVTVAIVKAVAIPARLAYETFIREASKKYGVDAALIHSVMETESAFDPMAVSKAGALGLMQLMPELAIELGVANPFDPRENIMAGTQYLRWLLNRHGGDVTLALASYNAGPTAVDEYEGVPPFQETEDYVQRVRALMARSRLRS